MITSQHLVTLNIKILIYFTFIETGLGLETKTDSLKPRMEGSRPRSRPEDSRPAKSASRPPRDSDCSLEATTLYNIQCCKNRQIIIKYSTAKLEFY